MPKKPDYADEMDAYNNSRDFTDPETAVVDHAADSSTGNQRQPDHPVGKPV